MPISESDPISAVRPVVGRLAPSPTGAQHLGNARTYLLAWLSARSSGGRVVLRIEDIDSPRVKPWAIEQAMVDLRWLGLDWDEGPDVGGPHAPYLQTERTASYDQALQRLVESDLAYPCTCTRKDIESAASAPHESIDDSINDPNFQDGPIYNGRCAQWKLGDALPAEGTFCWRFRTPDRSLKIVDQFYGELVLNPHQSLGDFPLTRKNGQAAYQLAVVVDDDAMEVTEVVRGDDLIPSVFRQLPLIEALGLARPQYFHVPLVVGPDGRRLAKRHGDTRLSQYRDSGVAPESIIGWAANSVGLCETNRPIQAAALVDTFKWSNVRKAQTVVDCPHNFT
jgi:glutamyl-tRNA synthetase